MRLVVLTMLPLVVSGMSGCVLADFARESARQARHTLTPRPTDYRDGSEEPVDEWSYVGDDARGSQPREQDPDPWWKNRVMSAKARHIERNLGYD